jgi:uncharacterized membrane protein
VTGKPSDDRAADAALEEWLAYSDEPQELHEPRVNVLFIVSVAIAVAVLVGMILLRPTGESRGQLEELAALGLPSQFHAADVVAVENISCAGAPNETCQRVAFELTSGPDVGYIYRQDFTPGQLTPEFDVGESAVLSYVAPPGRVDAIRSEPCDFDAELTCTTLTLLLGEGATVRPAEFQMLPGEAGTTFARGEQVLVNLFEGPGGELEIVSVAPVDLAVQYQYADSQRRGTLFWLALAFALVVVALGRLRGVLALAGLAASVIVLLQFVLPAILDGRSPVLVAVFGAAAIAYLALYLAHGFTRMTTVALLGTLAALALTALLSTVVVEAARFTGFATEESTLLTLFDRIDVRGLLLAGIVLGAVGAIDDVTVTQASAVWELRAANPSIGLRRLVRSGLRIGRDHIASTVNTLLLAYAGASLPLLVLFVLSAQSLGTVANGEVVAVEIVRTLVGSIGLVAAVPFTTWLAAYTVHRDGERGTSHKR